MNRKLRTDDFFRRHSKWFLGPASNTNVYLVWRHGEPRGRILMSYIYALSPEAACSEVHDLQFDVRRLPEGCRENLPIELKSGWTRWGGDTVPPGWIARHVMDLERAAHALAMFRFICGGGDLTAEAARQWEAIRVEAKAEAERRKTMKPAPFADDMPF